MMLSIDQYTVGMSAELEKTFSDEDVQLFAKLSGDINPVHLDEDYAQTTMFGHRIVHGAFASSMFSTLFANVLPGPGCIYLKSNINFLKPIYLNEVVQFKVEISEILPEKNRLIFQIQANSKGKSCISGTAEIYITPQSA